MNNIRGDAAGLLGGYIPLDLHQCTQVWFYSFYEIALLVKPSITYNFCYKKENTQQYQRFKAIIF